MKSQDAMGNKNFEETDWVASEADLQSAAFHGFKNGTSVLLATEPNFFKGRFRRNVCDSSGMGLKVSSLCKI